MTDCCDHDHPAPTPGGLGIPRVGQFDAALVLEKGDGGWILVGIEAGK